MFINKWLVTDSVANYKDIQTGLCLYLDKQSDDMANPYQLLQQLPVEIPFAILLSGNSDWQKAGEFYIDKIIGLFFQPSYYMINYQPLLFVNNGTSACSGFLEQLTKKSINQGFQNILVLETGIFHYTDVTTNQFAYWIGENNMDYSPIVKNWLDQFLDSKNPTEIHLLISSKEKNVAEILNRMLAEENVLQNAELYKIANAFYEQQKLIDECKHELSLKRSREKDIELYLSIQKEERANGLKWYYYEYEILPLWYKRFGHILKVIMGKRTFRSLFNDNVKKYKD